MPLTLTADDTQFITLSEVKAQANVTSSTSDAELELIRGAAQDVVQGIVGPVLWRTVTEPVRVSGGVAVLRLSPVVSLSSPVDAVLNAEAGMVTLAPYSSSPVEVTYTAGRAVVPDAIRLAALIIAAHLWETQKGVSPAQFDPGSDVDVTPMGFAIPRRATELLRPYSLGPSVA